MNIKFIEHHIVGARKADVAKLAQLASSIGGPYPCSEIAYCIPSVQVHHSHDKSILVDANRYKFYRLDGVDHRLTFGRYLGIRSPPNLIIDGNPSNNGKANRIDICS